MCGIIAYAGQANPKPILLRGLKQLEYRGYDSAGIAIMNGNGVNVVRAKGRVLNLEAKVRLLDVEGHIGIGQTRWATHGEASERNAHPHTAGSITLVHNGIVENYALLRSEILDRGRVLLSDTDTEIIAHLLDIEIQLGYTLQESLLRTVPRLIGSFAFVVVSDKEPESLIGVSSGIPLLLGTTAQEIYLVSDAQAILPFTNRVRYLEPGQLAICKPGQYHVIDLAGRLQQGETKLLTWVPEQLALGSFEHYMLKEIHEQPSAICVTTKNNIHCQDMDFSASNSLAFDRFTEKAHQFERICIVGCGTARHAAMIAQNYFENLVQLPVYVEYASEFRNRSALLNDATLLILISQSGETADTIASLRAAKEKGMTTVSICNVNESTLARESEVVLYTHAGPEISVASTKAFTAQLSLLYLLAAKLAVALGQLTRTGYRNITEELQKLPNRIGDVLSESKRIKEIAAATNDSANFFFLGRGLNYPIALEGALKLKEISYVFAEGYPSGELKHGPIALVSEKTTVIVLAPSFEMEKAPSLRAAVVDSQEKIMSNLQEVKSRGARIWSIATGVDERFRKESNFYTSLPAVGWASTPVLLSVVVQLYAYYFAVQKGTDVDKPRNLAKCVTVE